MARMRLRPYDATDAEAVLALNQSNLDGVGELDADRLAWLIGIADRGLVADDAGELAGFAITLLPGTAYDSVNYGWFGQRYDDFGYLDRIVVAPAYRRSGVGSMIYDTAEEGAGEHGRLTADVYAEPPNEVSLAFHRRRGYAEVGRLRQPNGKICAMLVKELA